MVCSLSNVALSVPTVVPEVEGETFCGGRGGGSTSRSGVCNAKTFEAEAVWINREVGNHKVIIV